MPRPVKALWYLGRLPQPGDRGLAMVGARAASMAGCGLARKLAAASARQGFAIVSGGALGIDAAAHRGALDAAGVTFAVLGCGVDVVYPDRHAALYADIAAAGGLISEYPPGTQPRSGQFPARNRIIAAFAGTVLVVEAGLKSGALITARLRDRPRPAAARGPRQPGHRRPDRDGRGAARGRRGRARAAFSRVVRRMRGRFRRGSRRCWPRFVTAGPARPTSRAG